MTGNPWQSTTRLQAVDLDGDGAFEVLALAADGITVLVLDDVLGASPTTTSFVASAPVLDLEALEWSTTPTQLEIAVLSTDGLTLHSPDGTFLRLFAHASASGQIARVQMGSAPDLVAWSRRNSADTASEIVTIRVLTEHAGEPLHFNACSNFFDVDPVTLTGSDYNGDGYDDLLITHEENESAIVMINQGLVGPPYFTSAGGVWMSQGVPGPGFTA